MPHASPDSGESKQSEQWIALLGRRDKPTDGVADYCACLRTALEPRCIRMDVVSLRWAEDGWFGALRQLSHESKAWQGKWVLLQYTALSWSRRGFPVGLLLVIALLRRRKVLLAAVFHDTKAYSGCRLLDRFRRYVQHSVMRRLAARAALIIVAAEPESLAWIADHRRKAVFVPVGSNVPPQPGPQETRDIPPSSMRTIAVFGVTEGANAHRELAVLHQVLSPVAASAPRVRVSIFGRGSSEIEPAANKVLSGSGLEVSVLGLLPAEEISKLLSRVDVQVQVRVPASSQRGSVIAGIVCGAPIVSFGALDADAAIREAGVLLVPEGDVDTFARELVRVLTDDSVKEELRARNRAATQKYFSWDAISGKIVEATRAASRTAVEKD